jgi:hypothetical protein
VIPKREFGYMSRMLYMFDGVFVDIGDELADLAAGKSDCFHMRWAHAVAL